MASKTSKQAKRSRACVAARKLPGSFEEALNEGYIIHEQLSSWHFSTANKREGFLLLTKQKANSKTLMVRYEALYDLSKPYLLESNRTGSETPPTEERRQCRS